MQSSPRSAFTLIELLVVIAIIAILAVVVVLTLNPAQLLAQSRDANRVSDMATVNSAINLYNTDQAGASSYSLGTSTQTYISIPDPNASSTCGSLGLPSLGSSTWACASSSTYRNASSTGWLPIAFNQISAGSPFSSLPVDPVNTTSSGLYYAYLPSPTTGSYELVARLESQKYASASGAGGADGGLSYQYLESGKDLTLAPTYAPKLLDRVTSTDYLAIDTSGLVGYWPLNDANGTTAHDQSGNGNNGTLTNSGQWTTGKLGSAISIVNSPGTSMSISMPSSVMPSTAITVSAWIYLTANYNWPGFLSNSWVGQPGSWDLFSNSSAYLQFGISGPATTTQNIPGGCSIATSAWHWAVGTYDGATMRSYLDGVLCGSSSLANQQLFTGTSIAPLSVVPGGGNFIIDDIRLYNRALSASEVQEIYNAEK